MLRGVGNETQVPTLLVNKYSTECWGAGVEQRLVWRRSWNCLPGNLADLLSTPMKQRVGASELLAGLTGQHSVQSRNRVVVQAMEEFEHNIHVNFVNRGGHFIYATGSDLPLNPIPVNYWDHILYWKQFPCYYQPWLW